jgi:L-arabinokinase
VIDDPLFKGYLANVPAADWLGRYRAEIPQQLLGSEFLARFQGTTDPTTTIDPVRRYPVRAATAHAIEEHQRVHEFRALLADNRRLDEQTRVRLGKLMYASHASYSACGLGSDATDRLVALVREAGPSLGLYGAKITGGGSGGTVAVLAARDKQSNVGLLAESYGRASGYGSAVYAGSSDGARAFGVRRLMCSGPN